MNMKTIILVISLFLSITAAAQKNTVDAIKGVTTNCESNACKEANIWNVIHQTCNQCP